MKGEIKEEDEGKEVTVVTEGRDKRRNDQSGLSMLFCQVCVGAGESFPCDCPFLFCFVSSDNRVYVSRKRGCPSTKHPLKKNYRQRAKKNL